MRSNGTTSIIIIGIMVLSIALVPETIHPVNAAPPYTWNAPTHIDQSPGLDALPAVLQTRNNGTWLAWQSQRLNQSYPKFDIFWKRGAGTVWSDPVNLTNVNLSANGNNASPTLVQLPNDTIIVFWSSLIGNSYKIVYETYHIDRFGNEFWSNQIQLTSTSLNDTSATATVARDGTLWLFWSRQNVTCRPGCNWNYQIYYKTAGRGAWSPDTRLTANAALNSSPNVMTGNDGRLRLIWEEQANVNVNTQLFYNTYNGISWGTESQIVSSTVPDAHPSQIQDRNGTLWLFWSRYQGPVGSEVWSIWGKYSVNNGGTWSAETQLTNNVAPVIDDTPSAIQSNTSSDKSIWVFFKSNLPTGTDYDVWAINSSPVSPVHNVAISTIAPVGCPPPCQKYPTPLKYAPIPQYANPVVGLTVMVSNPGDFGEKYNVTLTATNTTSFTLVKTSGILAPGASTNVVYNWNTTGLKPGRYALLATVVPLNSTETPGNQGDDSLNLTNQVWVLPLGNVDQDGTVDLIDVSIVFYDFGFSITCGCSRWNPYADINSNGTIDIIDASIAALNYGIKT